ncbi:beta-N-acetylhexosaminidase [Roseateles sp. LYH14W]|uniref:Beta-N-acetylhexosaminidase n=1 Tax=Pelomonas parva TaxID=3299032 RepID=A0ABW7FBN7_9BURK
MSTFDPGRLVMVDIPGQSLDAETAAFLREQKIRSVCLFRKNIGSESEVRALMRDLIDVLGPEALIGIDQEGGAVVRVTFLPQPPSAMALGASGDADRAEAVGAAVARGLKSLGINWNFAPVLDVNNNPSNPVIGERSFSNDPVEVSRLAAAWMRGSLKAGVACCVKHFPGHGDTHVDSHHALPTVDKSRAELNALELAPFKALASQAPAMMTAHIVYPQIDPDRPATLSPQLIGGILRQDWGYDGVVITDALMMKAVAERFGYAKSAVMAIEAGADMVLAQGSLTEQLVAINALRQAFDSGRLTPEQGETANRRLDTLAAAYPARVVDDSAARASDHVLMAEAWAAGLTTLRGAMPPALNAPIRVIVQGDVPTDMVSEAGPTGRQAVALFEAFSDAQVQMVDDIAQLDWTRVPKDGRVNVLVSTRRARYGLAASEWRPDLHLSLWNPYQALDVAGPTVLTWGFSAGALAGLKSWLEGRSQATGRAPQGLQ